MAASAGTSTTVHAKEFHFPVTVEWLGERRVAARVEGKPAVEIAPPPVFRGTDPSTWSPEDFFVAAAASCLAITFTGLAARAGITYTELKVDGDGIAGKLLDSDDEKKGGAATVGPAGPQLLVHTSAEPGTANAKPMPGRPMFQHVCPSVQNIRGLARSRSASARSTNLAPLPRVVHTGNRRAGKHRRHQRPRL